MYITLTKIDENANMGGWDAIEVTGKKLEDGSVWSKAFFARSTDLQNQLANFVVGDEVNVVMQQSKKNPKFWDIVGFKEVSADEREAVKTPYDPSKKKSGGKSRGSGGSSLTKAEWAEKDRLTNIRISKAVALKAAVDAGKKTKASIVKFADELLPYLLDTNIEGIAQADPLDPPV